MTQRLANSVNLPEEQRFFRGGLSWEKFKAIQASFQNVQGVRLFYCQGVLEIVTSGKPHEAIKCLIGLLLGQYFLEQGIEFFPSLCSITATQSAILQPLNNKMAS
ncbi:MAG: hypothetical protein RMZ69_12915 [Nostoc sp. ChiQUE01a]|nr:hypothetical protein [Nostoc sp. ChiQUE01a]